MSTIATIITAAAAFIITSIAGIWLIPFLRRLKFGQIINDIGPTWHKGKQGTPTMGGLMFIIGIVVATCVGYFTFSIASGNKLSALFSFQGKKMFAGLIMALAYAFIGFMDDFTKIMKKRNLGLTVKQKLVVQILVAVAYLAILYLLGDKSTVLKLPPFGEVDIGLFYYPLGLIIIIGFVNAVNLTDGLDGLNSSVTFVYALAFMLVSAKLENMPNNIFATAVAAGCLGFLVWNFYPAKVFMGDTGSMFLGGCVVSLGFSVNLPATIMLAGIVYLAEAFSVILQVICFKLTGKRIFKMSPIHHHFEMSGYSEVKIVVLFSVIGLVGGVLTILGVYNM